MSITKSRDCRRCPQCRAPFVKNGGCPSIVCQVCEHSFRYTDPHVISGVGENPQHSYDVQSTTNVTTNLQQPDFPQELFICRTCSSYCVSNQSNFFSMLPHCCLCLIIRMDIDIQSVCPICMEKAEEEDFL